MARARAATKKTTSKYHSKQRARGDFDEGQTPAPAAKRLVRVKPKTERQKALINAIQSGDQTFTTGPAGTGKTFVAAHVAAEMFAERKVSRIILTRPNVPSGPSLGFFAGTYEEKVAHWAVPLIEVLNRVLGSGRVEYEMKAKKIEIAAFETMRGRTFDDAFVILDEAQNTTPHEMHMFLTRIGEGAKVVVNGDVAQSDIGPRSGLATALRLMSAHSIPATHIAFEMDDIVRSGICGMWVRAFASEAEVRKPANTTMNPIWIEEGHHA